MDQFFDIVFNGDVVPGKSREEVVANIARLMKTDEASAQRLFERAPVVLRRRLPGESAKQVVQAFDRAGAVCRMVPAGESPAAPPEHPDTGKDSPPPQKEPLASFPAQKDSSRANPHFGGRMILTNLESVPGRTIVEHFGLVSGSTIRAKHVGRDIMASLKNLVGGELKGYTQLLHESRKQAVERMIAQAEQLGANAVVNVRFSTSSVAQGAAELYAYGTAVRVQ